MQQPLHMQLVWREFKALPYDERLKVFDDALKERQVIEALEYPITETLDEYQNRVWQELEL